MTAASLQDPLVRVQVDRAQAEGMPEARDVPVSAATLLAQEQALERAALRFEALRASGKLGFLAVGDASWELERTVEVARSLRGCADRLLVLGIGGSALGARALLGALGPGSGTAADPPGPGAHQVRILDTVDPVAVTAMLRELTPSRTAVAVVSKSGSTLETLALLRAVLPWLQRGAPADWRERTVVVTDPQQSPLLELARAEGLTSLPVPEGVGGRFSVLTAVGVLPAAFVGLDVDGLLEGGRQMAAHSLRPGLESNPAWRFAAIHQAWWDAGSRVSVLACYSSRLRALGDWFAQLLSESLGKLRPDGESVGWTPSVGEGPADQHSQLQLWQEGPRDKLVSLLGVDDPGEDLSLEPLEGSAQELGQWLQGRTLGELLDAERRATLAALVEAGRPVVSIQVPRLDAAVLGQLFVFFEVAVVLGGLLLGVDPLDQPGVEAGKRYARGLLGCPGEEEAAAAARRLLEDV